MMRQRGGALIVTLFALAVLLIAAISMLRSTGTATEIVGNTVSKQAAVEAADTALQAANLRLAAMSAFDANVSGAYYATQQGTDANGLPTIDWTTISSTTVGSFQVQYVIDRLCDAPLPVTDNAAQCSVAPAAGQSGSHRVGSPVYLPKPPIYYRVTARLVGPKSSETYVQAIVSK